jgi:succinyl-CoA synthetase alpha subunit
VAILVNNPVKTRASSARASPASFGAVHTKGCYNYGTKMVGGVTPGKGGTKDANGLPIFDTVARP